jgi:hypothetical protein
MRAVIMLAAVTTVISAGIVVIVVGVLAAQVGAAISVWVP